MKAAVKFWISSGLQKKKKERNVISKSLVRGFCLFSAPDLLLPKLNTVLFTNRRVKPADRRLAMKAAVKFWISSGLQKRKQKEM
jgi:hypothetical protein